MPYSYSYDTCDDQLDPHYDRSCDESPEKARIRRGAWVHKDVYADIIADPTDITLWQAAEATGQVVVMRELSGMFDGGTPKMGAGYGDSKEVYIGADFKATIKDPLYKENHAHYRSLVGKSSWHFAYLTESQVHITGKPVTVAPKNPITENVDDDVIWESEVSWFEYFTPAPHDAPMAFFQ